MRNLESLTPEELIVIATALSLDIMKGRTHRELIVIQSIAISVANLLSIASNQISNLNEIDEELSGI